MLRYLGAALEHGELPLWNPYHFSGHPSVADPQSLLFTPTMLLFGWLVPSAVDAALRRRRLRAFPAGRARLPCRSSAGAAGTPAGAVIAAMIFMLGGSASARLQHTGIIFSYGFFPLALLAARGGARPPLLPARRAVRRRRRHDDGRARPGRVPVRADADRRRRPSASCEARPAASPSCASALGVLLARWARSAARCSPSRCS